MDFRNVLKPLAALLFIIGCNMLIPAGIAFYNGEYNECNSFLFTILAITLIAGPVHFLLLGHKSSYMSMKDGFLFVSLSWVLASMFGALPFVFSGAIPSLADAFFETMSGFTTTGASILTAIEPLPRSILFWRSQTHWLGGMGIVVLTVAILPILSIGGLQLMRAEAPGPTVDKLTPRVAATAKLLWFIYLGMTITETVLLMAGGLDLYDALTHTFGTLATGGFSTYNSSVGHFSSPYVQNVITIFMVLAGMNFTLHYRFLSGRIKQAFFDAEFIVYLFIFFVTSLIITTDLMHKVYGSFAEAFRYASFQTASILTTTGYATCDFETWPYVSQVMLFLMMFIGGCAGSTGGGIKVVRILTLFKMGLNEMKYLIHPKGIFQLRINGQIVRKEVTYSIAGFFFLYMFILLLTTLVVSFSGTDILTSFTTALATVGNIGPGFGMIGPADNYAFYPSWVKWFLSLAMMMGRLEIYTVLVLFTPFFWKR